jgi:hypothetical protein
LQPYGGSGAGPSRYFRDRLALVMEAYRASRRKPSPKIAEEAPPCVDGPKSPFWVCAVRMRRFPVGASPRSSQQGCRSRRWETSAVNCPFGRLAYPMRGKVTNRVLLGRKRRGRPGIQSGRQRWERPGWQQTRRLEDHRMTAAAKSTPVLKSLNGFLWNSRPSGTGGRPM